MSDKHKNLSRVVFTQQKLNMDFSLSTIASFVFVLAAKGVECSKSYITCASIYSTKDCYGSGAYCCGINDDECCWFSVYSYWWFWFVWFWVFLLVMSCCIWACVRRRRRQAQIGYMVVDPQQTYGTVVTAGPPEGYVQPPVYSAVPPSAPSYMQKPPPYSAVANPNQ